MKAPAHGGTVLAILPAPAERVHDAAFIDRRDCMLLSTGAAAAEGVDDAAFIDRRSREESEDEQDDLENEAHDDSFPGGGPGAAGMAAGLSLSGPHGAGFGGKTLSSCDAT